MILSDSLLLDLTENEQFILHLVFNFVLLHCALSVKMMLGHELCTEIEIMRLKKVRVVH